jgi:hypothetical protein
VNDPTTLWPIVDAWNSLGCDNVVVQCPGVKCPDESHGTCAAGDDGGGTCVGSRDTVEVAP